MVFSFIYPFSNSEPILVTDETCTFAQYTFPPNGQIWEYNSLSFMKELIQTKLDNKGVFVDVGAQVGLYTLTAKYYPQIQYHSFEPFPESLRILKQNIDLNQLTNVKVYDFALSNVNAKVPFSTCKSHNGLHTLGNNPTRFSDVEKIEIETKKLDDIENLDCIDYMKMDTEGWEYFVLLGALKKIKSYPPKVIQLEVNHINLAQTNVTQMQLLDLMKELGYTVEKVMSDEQFFVYTN